MNINSKLVTFAQQELVLGYTNTERDSINASLNQLEKVLKDKLSGQVKNIIRFGSYTRNTILPRKYDPQSDVDLMVVFDTSAGKRTPGTYRKWILDALTTAYPFSISKKDFPAVKLLLNHIMFDVVPAHVEDYYWDKTYFIPNSNDSWKDTTPNDINQDLGSSNQNYGNNTLRNVIRLCKHWNAMKAYPFESYSMEKEIISMSFYGDNTYDGFMNTMRVLANHMPGVSQALDSIDTYKGNFWREADELKQLQWLQKLLPGLK